MLLSVHYTIKFSLLMLQWCSTQVLHLHNLSELVKLSLTVIFHGNFSL